MIAVRAHPPFGPVLWVRRSARLWGLGVVLALIAAGPGSALAAPRAELWQRWTAHDPGATTTIDHSAWGRLLRTYLAPPGAGARRFAYGRVSAADKHALDAYVRRLSALPISRYNRAEQRAFWINLYNALTVRVVIAHYPVDSIRDIDISPGLFADGPWGRKLVEVEGVALSLNDIEHRILRPIWRDPRVHYALNCAALGCPDLLGKAFTGANTDALLDGAARRYINSPRGARVVHGRLIVSSIYVWYEADFGGNDVGVLAHLRKYAAPPLRRALAGVTRIGDDAYDWRLNDAADR